ncbi:hypothetical protein DVH24_026433 [Malus domestica]|uniref:Uncharacterized protein n=1 Tax=Malus domestica TaxID=3750 RepID=A0A498KIL3_MALDO|nr:hypothetical protein DVH24_026433 [Malus domestica]
MVAHGLLCKSVAPSVLGSPKALPLELSFQSHLGGIVPSAFLVDHRYPSFCYNPHRTAAPTVFGALVNGELL